MTPSLIVIMGQDRTTNDWQVGIRTRKIAWKLLYDSQQTLKALPTNRHRTMLTI